METKQVIENNLQLAKDEYFVVRFATPGKYYGTDYTCHRTLSAARKRAKKVNGRVFVASNGTSRYEVVR